MAVSKHSLAAVLLCAATHAGALAQEGAPPTPQPPQRAPEQGRAPGQTAPSPSPEGQMPEMVSKEQQLQMQGKISEVWDAAPLDAARKRPSKVVVVETDQGQTIAASLAPSEAQQQVDKGASVIITGAVVSVQGAHFFVPQRVQLGDQPTELQPMRLKLPEGQQVKGKIVDTREMGAKGAKAPETQVAIVETGPQERVVVDLGPADQLRGVKLQQGAQVEIDGVQTSINDQDILVAQELRTGGTHKQIQRRTPKEAQPQPKQRRPLEQRPDPQQRKQP